jgi:hypothetical protein
MRQIATDLDAEEHCDARENCFEKVHHLEFSEFQNNALLTNMVSALQKGHIE